MYDEFFKVVNVWFVIGMVCEVLYCVFGDYFVKCVCEYKVLRREFGKWFFDVRLSKIMDEVCVYKNSDNEFRVLGGYIFFLFLVVLCF